MISRPLWEISSHEEHQKTFSGCFWDWVETFEFDSVIDLGLKDKQVIIESIFQKKTSPIPIISTSNKFRDKFYELPTAQDAENLALLFSLKSLGANSTTQTM